MNSNPGVHGSDLFSVTDLRVADAILIRFVGGRIRQHHHIGLVIKGVVAGDFHPPLRYRLLATETR